MFACELCEISKNTFFTEHLRASASGIQPLDVCGRPDFASVIFQKQLFTFVLLKSCFEKHETHRKTPAMETF